MSLTTYNPKGEIDGKDCSDCRRRDRQRRARLIADEYGRRYTWAQFAAAIAGLKEDLYIDK